MNPLKVEVAGLRTGGGLNARLHWAARARRVKDERSATWLAFAQQGGWSRQSRVQSHLKAGGRVSVTLVRCSPGNRPMDDDNVRGSLKAVRDEVAAWLGVDDGSPSLCWKYSQLRAPWGVKVSIEEA
jgi:hypothetical protein